jgi:acyl-CoA synthetase (AMP-forming)/AMP-acid ligase II
MGLIGHVLQPVYAGIHNFFLPSSQFVARPLDWLKAISRYRITISGGPNFAFRHCLQKTSAESMLNAGLDLRCWRVAYCGADCIFSETLLGFAEQLRTTGFAVTRFFPCYGMAESTLFVTGRFGLLVKAGNEASGWQDRWVALGPAGSHIRIVDPKRCHELAEDCVGEIWLQSDSVAQGYHGNNTYLDDAFGARLADDRLPFLRTGDLGLIHQGELYVIGRIKNQLKIRGRPLHSEDLENVLLSRLSADGVLRCVVFAGQHNGAEALVVLLEAGRRRLDGPLVGIVDRVRSCLCEVSGIIPDIVQIVPAGRLPLTTSGKIKRSDCARMIREVKHG